MCKAASHSKVALTVFLTNPLKYSHTKKPALFLLWSVNALIMKSENSLRILKLHFSYCFVENLVRFLLYIILLHYIIQFLAVFFISGDKYIFFETAGEFSGLTTYL